MIGKIFRKRYEIIEKLGSGGTSIVYKGRDMLLNRMVTIKILHDQYANDEAFVHRFRHEAQAVARLSHPNIVSIYDVAFEEDMHYLVMEYIDGESLKEYIQEEGHLSIKESVEIGSQILDGLQHAHEHKIIHRDIKPHNILLTKDHQVKVTDFGIAVAVSDMTQTFQNNIIGSVHYMAPEQVRGATASERSDLYSAGVVMYEMLTGKQPYIGDSPIGVAMQHVQGEIVPPHKINGEVPLELSSIVMRAMRKNPDLRYNSAQDMHDNIIKVKLDKPAGVEAELPVLDEVSENTMEILPLDKEELMRSAEAAFDQNQDQDQKQDIDDDDIKKELIESQNGTTKKAKTPLTPKQKKMLKWGLIAGSILLAIIIALSVYLLVGLNKNNKELEVPNVVSLTLDEARSVLDKEGIDFKIETVYNDEIKEDIVIEQSVPPGGKIKASQQLKLFVSKGPDPLVLVPNVEGMSRESGEKLLNEHDLTSSIKTEYSGSVDKGDIISQSPSKGERVDKNTVINLVVSKGPAPTKVTVPSLYGLSIDDAKIALQNSNLGLGSISKETSTKYSEGQVCGQNIEAGKKVEANSTVNIVISSGSGSTDNSNSGGSKPSTPSPSPQRFNMDYTIPDDGSGKQVTVAIIVNDEKGSREEYVNQHHVGDNIKKNITYYGRGSIQVSIDGVKTYSQSLP